MHLRTFAPNRIAFGTAQLPSQARVGDIFSDRHFSDYQEEGEEMPHRRSPPKHRHDGTSPLPLGMDWCPPPKRWNGRDTIWPHDPHTGWSYCVTIPSWIAQPQSGTSDDNLINPIVFYRVQVGIQSPGGISTSHGLIRRFSDFLKLFSALKKAFPKKNIPPAPPKHALLRINSSRFLLEERRYALEEWMGKLLSDIDLSRSVHVASFLELEAAARSSFQDISKGSLETSRSGDSIGVPTSSQTWASSGASVGNSLVASTSHSTASDCGSENSHEISEMETPRQGTVHNSESSNEDQPVVQEHSSQKGKVVKYGMSGHDNGHHAGECIWDRPEDFSRGRVHSGYRMEITNELEHDKLFIHAQKLSAESVGSDMSSIRGSELSNLGTTNSLGDGFVDPSVGGEAATNNEAFRSMEVQSLADMHLVLPLDQQHKLDRVLITMQRRLATVKTDMEDLIARLNQEIAVKEYLSTKVKDLEVELEGTKQRSKENLQQALLFERERVTKMQWDMDELRRKSLEMESRLKSEQNERIHSVSEKVAVISEKEMLRQELNVKREQVENLQKHLEEVEMKSKGDIKVLVKEVKFLRNSQAELKEVLNQSMKEKTELEEVLRKEKQIWEQEKLTRKKLLRECGILHRRLLECSVNFLTEEEDKFNVNHSSISDALDLLTTSDNRTGLLLAEAQLLARNDESDVVGMGKTLGRELAGKYSIDNGEDHRITNDDMRKMLADAFTDNARLRKQVISVTRAALKTVIKPEKEGGDGTPSRKTVLTRFLER